MWMSVTVWLALAVGMAILLGLIRSFRTTDARRLDVGSVSNQWVAEHCVGFDESPEAPRVVTSTITFKRPRGKG